MTLTDHLGGHPGRVAFGAGWWVLGGRRAAYRLLVLWTFLDRQCPLVVAESDVLQVVSFAAAVFWPSYM